MGKVLPGVKQLAQAGVKQLAQVLPSGCEAGAKMGKVLPGVKQLAQAGTATSVRGGGCWRSVRSRTSSLQRIPDAEERKLKSQFPIIWSPAPPSTNLRIWRTATAS